MMANTNKEETMKTAKFEYYNDGEILIHLSEENTFDAFEETMNLLSDEGFTDDEIYDMSADWSETYVDTYVGVLKYFFDVNDVTHVIDEENGFEGVTEVETYLDYVSQSFSK